MNHDMLRCAASVCLMLGRAVAERAPLPEDLPDIAQTMAFCDAHRLHALLASAVSLRSSIPDAYQPLITRGMQQVAAQIKTDATEDALSRLFSDAGIRHIVLKGSHTRSFYPSTLSRTSADIDWQIDPADAARADALLSAQGWTCKSADPHERCYEKAPRARLELHLTPEGFHDEQKQLVQRLFDRAIVVDGLRFHLTDSDAYIYTVFHLYKHFVLAGAGVRMFLDVYAMETHADLERDYIDDMLRALNCAAFETRVRQINAVLFDNADSNDDLVALIRYVFAARAYGVASAQLALESINSTLTNTSAATRFSRNYGFDMRAMQARYPCLRHTRWLYPFCVIHRVCHGLRFRRLVLRQALDNRQQSRRDRDDFHRLLQLAGIL